MTKKEIKNCLEYRLQRLKELTGENYVLDWYHGIVALQVIWVIEWFNRNKVLGYEKDTRLLQQIG